MREDSDDMRVIALNARRVSRLTSSPMAWNNSIKTTVAITTALKEPAITFAIRRRGLSIVLPHRSSRGFIFDTIATGSVVIAVARKIGAKTILANIAYRVVMSLRNPCLYKTKSNPITHIAQQLPIKLTRLASREA
jgi:hypothetical protein